MLKYLNNIDGEEKMVEEKTVIVEFTGEKPEKFSEGAAAYDLVSAETVILLPGEVQKVLTKTSIAIPEGYVGLLNIRSSLGKRTIMLANGTGIIDSDYRGPLILQLYNGNVKDFLMMLAIDSVTFEYEDGGLLYKKSVPGSLTIKEGERIGQLSIVKQLDIAFEKVDKLSETARGEGGFGSTGK